MNPWERDERSSLASQCTQVQAGVLLLYVA